MLVIHLAHRADVIMQLDWRFVPFTLSPLSLSPALSLSRSCPSTDDCSTVLAPSQARGVTGNTHFSMVDSTCVVTGTMTMISMLIDVHLNLMLLFVDDYDCTVMTVDVKKMVEWW